MTEVKTLPIDVDPAEVAVAMLKAALPGFESRIDGHRDQIEIRGALPIATTVSAHAIYYPIRRSDVFVDIRARHLYDAIEPDVQRLARHERQREALRHELGPYIEMIAENVRRFGIEALGLEPVIAEREKKAHDRGRREGWAGGDSEGYARGRREAMADMVAAFRDAGFALDEMHGVDDE